METSFFRPYLVKHKKFHKCPFVITDIHVPKNNDFPIFSMFQAFVYSIFIPLYWSLISPKFLFVTDKTSFNSILENNRQLSGILKNISRDLGSDRLSFLVFIEEKIS